MIITKAIRDRLLAGKTFTTLVKRDPIPFSHIFQHPAEGWWTLGENIGRTYMPPQLKFHGRNVDVTAVMEPGPNRSASTVRKWLAKLIDSQRADAAREAVVLERKRISQELNRLEDTT
jgi:hypothetical protein